MNNTESTVEPRELKQIWQEYLKAAQQEIKEEKLEEFLVSLVEFKSYEDSSSLTESKLVSIGNLLGCELLKVISSQCEILEHDSALVDYFQKGSGLYLLLALHILADQVNNCNSEVSNVLVSVLPCLLSVSCELKDEEAFALLEKLSILYKDITGAKKNSRNLSETLLPSAIPPASKKITLLQLFGLVLDIINKLCTKGCTLTIAESLFNVADKLTTLLLEFSRDNKLKDSNDSGVGEDFPECTWMPTVKLVCTCMVLFPLWTISVARGDAEAFSHRIDQRELVKKLLEVTRNQKDSISNDTDFQNGHFEEQNMLNYQLSLMYSILGLVLTLIKDSACCEAVPHSGVDLTRKLHSREQVNTFVKSGGTELITFMSHSLNKVLNDNCKANMDCECDTSDSLLRQKASFVMTTTSQLISAMKKAMFWSSKSNDQKFNVSPTKDVSKDSGRHYQDSCPFRIRLVSNKSLPLESSSDSDSETLCKVNVSKQQYHSNKDCVVSHLCFTMLLVYEASTVEEIDVVSLNSLSRCGACSCMDVSAMAMALLSRFAERTSQVQNLALGLLCKILLKDIVTSDSQENTDDALPSETSDVTSPGSERWSFLNQLYLLATENNGNLSITILTHLKVLAKFGSPQLREALFNEVILPFLLKYKDTKRANTLSQVCEALPLHRSSTPNDSSYGTPAEVCERGASTSKESDDAPQRQKSENTVSDDALRISLTSLSNLLESERSLQRLFLNSDGVKSIVNFLGYESLHSICLGILQLLAALEDSDHYQEKSTKNQSPETVSENKDLMVVRILWRSMVLLDPIKDKTQKSSRPGVKLDEFAPKIECSLRSPKALRLLCQLWRTCLELLKTNSIFRELFVQSNGPSCIVVVLQVVKEYLKGVSSAYDGIKDHVVGCVTFMEHAVAVGLEFEEEIIDDVQLGIQITEAVQAIQQLLYEDKVLKDIAGKAFCTSLLNLSVGAVAADSYSSKSDIQDAEKLLFDLEDSDDSTSDTDYFTVNNLKSGSCFPRTKDLEPGYEADVEMGTCSSDVSSKENDLNFGKVGRTKEILTRRPEVADGVILYPQMCKQLLNFLEHNSELNANDKVLLLFGLEGIVSLASYSKRNREILCQQSIISLVLKTFTPCLLSVDQSLKGVQKTVLDLIVVLAGYQFSSDDLKTYLKLLETNKPILSSLIKALQKISSPSVNTHGPSYVHEFPVKRTLPHIENSNHKSQTSASQNESETPSVADGQNFSLKEIEKTSERYLLSHSSGCGAPEMADISLTSWGIKAIELKLNQTLPWPVGCFSLAFWLYLDSGLAERGDRYHHARRLFSRGGHARRSRGGRARKVGSKNSVHVASFGTKTALFEVWVNFLKTTLICRWSACDPEDNIVPDATPPTQETFVKFPLKDHVWHHLALSVCAGPSDDVTAGKVTLIVDGSFEATKILPYPGIPVRKNKQVSLLIGETATEKNDGMRNSAAKFEQRPSCKLGNVVAFIGNLHRDGSSLTGLISILNSKSQEKLETIDKHGASYLKLMGVNCRAVEFHLSEITSERYSAQLDLEILGRLPEDSSQSFLRGPHGEPVLVAEQQLTATKVSLKKQLLLVYSPVTPSEFLEYKLEGTSWRGNTSHGDNVMTGHVSSHTSSSVCRRGRLEEAIHSVGGIGVFLFLFAKTVEKTNDEKAQADALSIIFTIAKANIAFAKELEGLLANKMVLKVLLTPHFTPGYHFAKVFFSAACEGEVFRETGLHDKPYLVNLNTTAIVKNYEILREFLLSWRIWYRPGLLLPWETVLLALEALTSNIHPFSEFNVKQFERADALGILLLGCQEIQTEDLPFSSSTSTLHLNIIQNLLGCPADLNVLKRVCEFLVAVHPTYETVVNHGPGNLYFSPIAKLQERKTSIGTEIDSNISPRRNYENDVDETTTDGKPGTSDGIKGKSLGTPFENAANGKEECEDGAGTLNMIMNHFSHGEIARTNVLSTDDSKDMIISVEHLREPEQEIPEMNFPLQSPDSENLAQVVSPSSPKLRDPIDSSPQSPLQNPSAPLSPSGPGKQSEPIAIDSRETTSSVADSYDVVSSSEFTTSKSQSFQTANSNDDYLVVENKPGHSSSMSTYRHYRRNTSEFREYKKLDEVRVGLLELIYSALVNLADTAVDTVLGELLKVEYFLCIVNHPVPRVRTLAVEILHRILERGSPNVINLFRQMSGYHLLADQIHLHSITQELAEASFLLFFQQPVSINQANFLESIKHGSELAKKINIQAVVPLLGMLEGSTSCPKIFQFLVQSFVKVLDVAEDFLLKATDYGLLKILVNAIRALCILKLDYSQKNEFETAPECVLDNIQYLIMAIVYRSLRMCGERYFQIFDDLLLSLDRLQYSEPRNKRLTLVLVQCSRFLQQCALRFALEYFEFSQSSNKINRRGFKKSLRLSFKSTADNNVQLSEKRTSGNDTYWATFDPKAFPVPWQTDGRVTLPAEATPAEIASRFQEVCKKTVNFIYFQDNVPKVENSWDFNLNYSQFTLPPPFEMYKQADSSFLANASATFTQWAFCFLLQLLEFCLVDGTQRYLNKWQELIYQSKDKIRHQLCRLFIYLMNPSQECKYKYFVFQLTKLKHGNDLFLNLLLGAITTKQKERTVAYVLAFLRERERETSEEEKELLETVESYLKDVEVQKFEKNNDDYLTQKQQEWEKQDCKNKIQWESKKEADQRRGDQELHQLCDRIMSVAMEVTKVSVDVQDKQRQNLLKHVKAALSSDVQSQKLWQMVVKQMTHERAIWHDKVFFPTSWQLDRTEGPCRVRCRLQRCHLDIDEKFIMPEHRKRQSRTLPLSYLFEEHCEDASSKSVYHIFHTTDTIRFLHRCNSIIPAGKVQGEVLIGEKRVYFVGEEAVADLNTAQFFLDDEDVTSISWLFQEIREIVKRRYALKDNALEIFLTNGRTFLLAFETTEDRETVYKELIAKELPNLITSTENLAELTQRWQNGELTNFAYLTELNKQACRSFNDLMQYPIFPLVLADYSCDVLDLTNTSVYRNLSKPVAVQNPCKVAKFQETYRSLLEQYDISKKLDPMNCIPPYHYGSHYSNSGTVLHFLVRLVPFTKMFLTYQDKQFDVPDRTFHAIETTWNLSSFASAPDVKELIPEFFFLPEFLLNSEGFNFGFRQNGKRVMDVVLPSWAKEDFRLFILIHRQALESDIVSSSINNWIDLVFGFKQTGQAAIDAINVFHPSTYVGGIDEKKLLEPLQRQAVQTMIETYGQTPAKLFEEPHPEKKRLPLLDSSLSIGTFVDTDSQVNQNTKLSTAERTTNKSQEVPSPVPTVYGIKWGSYVGSPAFPRPLLCWADKFPSLVSRLVCFPGSHLLLLPPNAAHTIVTRWKNKITLIDWLAVISWNHVDGIIRIRDMKKGTTSCFIENMNLHKVTCCAVSEECRSLWVGSSTGCLCVWTTRYDRNTDHGLEIVGRRIRLQGHHASITCVEICEAFSIVVTGSEDRTAIIWDLNRLCYIRSLPEHSTAVTVASVSPTSGDIVTVCHTATDTGSELRLCSVNGRPIKKIVCQEKITCVQFSRAPEGVSVNAVAAGLENGVVRLWNTWTLDHMCDITDGICQLPIVCLAYSHTSHHLFTADSSGTVRAWGRANRAGYKPRILNGTH